MQASGNTNRNNEKDSPFMLFEDSAEHGTDDTAAAHRPSWNFWVSNAGKTVRLTLIANHDRVCLSDIVPAAHRVCDIITRLAAEQLAESGKEISCKKGCAHCCSYMVSLSSAEAFYLQKHIHSLDAGTRRPIMHSFLRGARTIAANKIPPVNTPDMDESQRLESISDWYQKMNIKCPFIVDNECSQYDARPLVCREHMVTSPPAGCRPFSGMFTKTVELPFSTAEVLMEISNHVESTLDEAILLPLTMAWCNANTQRAQKKYPAALLAEKFIETVNAKTTAMA